MQDLMCSVKHDVSVSDHGFILRLRQTAYLGQTVSGKDSIKAPYIFVMRIMARLLGLHTWTFSSVG